MLKRILWLRALRRWLFPHRLMRVATIARPHRRFTRPRLEVLEDRTLLTAHTYLVNLNGDNGGPSGTMVTQFSGDLRYCITQADLPQNAGSTITFSGSLNNTLTLEQGELPISQNMTIAGPGSSTLTISGGFIPVTQANPFGSPGSRIFDITSNTARVSISGLTLTQGNASPFQSLTPGNQGGDLFNGGQLTLNNMVIENGMSQGIIGGPPGRGGGIYNGEGGAVAGTNASLTITNTVITGNVAQGELNVFSGLGAGGGIYNDTGATLTLAAGTSVTNNKAYGFEIYSTTVPYQSPAPPKEKNGLNAPRTFRGNDGARGDDGAAGFDGVDGGPAYGGGVFSHGFLTISGATFRVMYSKPLMLVSII